MNLETIEMIVLTVAVIAFVTIRQTRWSPVSLGKLFRMPFIFGLIGVVGVAQAAGKPGGIGRLGGLDVAVIAVELVIGVVAGWLMGAQTEIATVGGVTRSRLRPAGLAIWLGFIGVRIGLGVLGSVFGLAIATQPTMIFLVLAAVKSVQAVMVRQRIDQHRAELQEPAYALAAR